MIYFTADTHFSSERTLKLSRRPFSSIHEMDWAMIFNWNTIVKKEDTVYHIGDFGNYNMIKHLNGKIVLICGKYEEVCMKDNKLTEPQFKDWLKSKGFNDVIFKSHSIYRDCTVFNLTHKPEDYMKSNSVNTVFNLFGHIHKLQMVKKFGLNVGVDCHDFTPISFETVMFYKDAIGSHYDNNVFMVD